MKKLKKYLKYADYLEEYIEQSKKYSLGVDEIDGEYFLKVPSELNQIIEVNDKIKSRKR